MTWEGEDDGDPKCGRGWAVIEGDGVMSGRIFIHRGDDTAFVAERAVKAGATTARRRRKQ